MRGTLVINWLKTHPSIYVPVVCHLHTCSLAAVRELCSLLFPPGEGLSPGVVVLRHCSQWLLPRVWAGIDLLTNFPSGFTHGRYLRTLVCLWIGEVLLSRGDCVCTVYSAVIACLLHAGCLRTDCLFLVVSLALTAFASARDRDLYR